MSRSQIIGIADCSLSTDPSVTLVTYALGSCIAVVLHEPVAGVAGLLHFMLPEPMGDARRAEANLWTFATTGVPLLLTRAQQMGALKKKMNVKLIGGAHVLDDSGFFDIGRKNHVAVRKVLWREGILVQSEAIGGSEPRTVWLDVATGKVRVRQGGRAPEEMPSGPKGAPKCLSAS